MRKIKVSSVKPKTKWAILVDGDCEFWYIQMLKRNFPNLSFDPRPLIPQRKTLPEQFQKIKEYALDYDQVFWIIDLDVLTDETRKGKKGTSTALDDFRKYCTKLEKLKDKVTVIVNNPCFEFWLLLHFEATSRFFNNCSNAEKQLKKHLKNYEKTAKYYTGQNNDIFLKLSPKIETAITNAKKLGKFDFNNPETGISEMYNFFDLPELKQVLDKAKAQQS